MAVRYSVSGYHANDVHDSTIKTVLHHLRFSHILPEKFTRVSACSPETKRSVYLSLET